MREKKRQKTINYMLLGERAPTNLNRPYFTQINIFSQIFSSTIPLNQLERQTLFVLEVACVYTVFMSILIPA